MDTRDGWSVSEATLGAEPTSDSERSSKDTTEGGPDTETEDIVVVGAQAVRRPCVASSRKPRGATRVRVGATYVCIIAVLVLSTVRRMSW